mmetsp:Transcript_27805/g.28256  ORF Transcript_27805/g.28256 Transcript_27805/m.28256 type:complete len:244 (+) Transcript_27805:153-884(+)
MKYESGIERSYRTCPPKFFRGVHWRASAQPTTVVRTEVHQVLRAYILGVLYFPSFFSIASFPPQKKSWCTALCTYAEVKIKAKPSPSLSAVSTSPPPMTFSLSDINRTELRRDFPNMNLLSGIGVPAQKNKRPVPPKISFCIGMPARFCGILGINTYGIWDKTIGMVFLKERKCFWDISGAFGSSAFVIPNKVSIRKKRPSLRKKGATTYPRSTHRINRPINNPRGGSCISFSRTPSAKWATP